MARGSHPSLPLRASTVVIYLLQLIHAFQPTAFLPETSKYTDDSLEAAATNTIQGRPNTAVPPTFLPTLDAGVMDAHENDISSRRGFLRDVAGLGVGTATGALSTPWAANAVVSGDAKNNGRCPPYEAVDDFNIRKYMGIWYELAYYDWTQNNVCGCTRFNMTQTDNRVLDAFTAVCPYGYTAAKTYIINMHEEMNVKTPGSFKEYAFYHSWDNKVIALWRSTGSPGGSESYERAIQMQCMEIFGRRAFVGINFLSRVPIVPPEQLTEMFEVARALGIAEIGGNPTQMNIVPHEGCRYPSSTENVEKLSLGSGLGVNTLAI